ncbi:MAG TPA: flavodoxin [Candidatus Pseudogracilibacillus intestinigallinarum]|uniref:Flavodoxin n=1 Tax=Candidatus Pseudogracilibacillus intestinigallinarum TaxID=2838742 RepID=A0A9D1PMZ4_9BACI|nr:flavodoxin [Candidatus Pseudogracilibacillus intestinigallinarum]
MRTLIAYLSYSGNTEEIAEHIERKLVCEGIEVDMLSIGIDYVPDLSEYDYIFLGTFTWDMGGTPDEVKDFVLEVGYKPNNIAVFGSGDTQFGGDAMFCGAVDKLVKFYESKWDGLKIEQSPRGSQEVLIDNWLEGVLEDVRITA